MSWRDQPRGYGGDRYRPRDRSRHRSRSMVRKSYYEDPPIRPQHSSRVNSVVSGLDGAPPPPRDSVTPTRESARSPRENLRGEANQPPTGLSASRDSRASKKPTASLNMGNKPNAVALSEITDELQQTAKSSTSPSSFVKYLELLVKLAVLNNDANTVTEQVSDREFQKQNILDLHPEAKEVHVQFDTMTEQLRQKLDTLNGFKEKMQTEISTCLNHLPIETKKFLDDVVPEHATRTISGFDKPKLDYEAISKRVQLSEERHKLRNMEIEKLEKQILASDEKWLARIKILEDRDRAREEEMKAFKAILFVKLEEYAQIPAKSAVISLETDINKLKNIQEDHKHKFADLGNQFLQAHDFRVFQKNFDDFKRNLDIQPVKSKLEDACTKLRSLEHANKNFQGEISTLAENTSRIKSDLADFIEREVEHVQSWNLTKDRLHSVAKQSATFVSLPKELEVVSKKVESQAANFGARQQFIEEQISTLRTSVEVPEDLKSRFNKLSDSQDQRFQTYITKTQNDVQTFIEKAQRNLQAAVASLPSRTAHAMNSEERKELDKIKLDIQRVEMVNSNLNMKLNQLSTGPLYKQITSWMMPSLARIPELEEASKANHTRLSDLEKNVTKFANDLEDTKKHLSQTHNQTVEDKNVSERFGGLETSFAAILQGQKGTFSQEQMTGLRDRIQQVENLVAQLPALYHTKENGDDVDRRLHLLESLEIKDDFQDLREKHGVIKKLLEGLQDEIEESKEEVKSLREAQIVGEGAVTDLKETCDARQREIDAQEGSVEKVDQRLSEAEKTLGRLVKTVKRIDEEAKTDIHSIKEEIASLSSPAFSTLHFGHLASSVNTPDIIRGFLEPYVVHRVWFGGEKPGDNAKTITWHAIVIVNRSDAQSITANFRNARWKGRTIKITLVDDNHRLEPLLQPGQSSRPAAGFQREGTVSSVRHDPPASGNLPTSPLARTATFGSIPSRSPRTSEFHLPTDTVPAPPQRRARGMESTPVVILGSQDQDLIAQMDQNHSNDDDDDDDDNDTIEVRGSDNLAAWTGPPPGKVKVRNSPSHKSRTSSTTPGSSRKRSNQEGKDGANKKARHI